MLTQAMQCLCLRKKRWGKGSQGGGGREKEQEVRREGGERVREGLLIVLSAVTPNETLRQDYTAQ